MKTQSNQNSIPLALLNTSARHSGKSGILSQSDSAEFRGKAEAVPVVSTGVYWGLCALRICETYQNCMFWLSYSRQKSSKWYIQFLAPRLKNFYSCSTQLSTKFILLINVKMPTIIGIFKCISMINTTSERLKQGSSLSVSS